MTHRCDVVSGPSVQPEGTPTPGHPRSAASLHPHPGPAGVHRDAELLPLGLGPRSLHLPDGTPGPQREALLPRDRGERGADDARHLHPHGGPRLSEVRAHLPQAQVCVVGVVSNNNNYYFIYKAPSIQKTFLLRGAYIQHLKHINV